VGILMVGRGGGRARVIKGDGLMIRVKLGKLVVLSTVSVAETEIVKLPEPSLASGVIEKDESEAAMVVKE